MPAVTEVAAYGDVTMASPDFITDTGFSYGPVQLDSYIGKSIGDGENFVADIDGGISSALFIPIASLGPVESFNIYIKMTSTITRSTWTLSVQPFFRAKRIEFVEPATQVGDKIWGATTTTAGYPDVCTRTTGSTATHETVFQFYASNPTPSIRSGLWLHTLDGGLGVALFDVPKANYMLMAPYIVVNIVNAGSSGNAFRIDNMAIWGSVRKRV